MSIDLAILLVSNSTNFLLGIIVFLRNPRQWVNRLFGLLAVSFISWTTFNFLADNAKSNNLLFTRLTFVSALFFIYNLTLVSRDIPDPELNKNKKYNKILPYLLAATASCAVSPYFVTKVVHGRNNIAELTIGPLYYAFIVYMVTSLVIFVINFVRQYRKTSDSSERNQIRLILTGTLLYSFAAIVSNVLLPALSNSWSPSRFGPVFTVIFVGWTGYAIVRHRFLDIRLIVARALGYVLTLLTVAGFYSLFIFVFLAGLLGGGKISVAQRSIYSILAVLFGFSLPPLKRFFDKLTNTLFYKDAYDAQAFLDTFNKTLVGNIDLQPLLRESAELIETTLKAEYCLFGIRETENTPRRMIGTKNVTFKDEDVAETMALTPHIHQKVIVVDDLEENHTKLKETLGRNNVAILARLISSVNQKQGQGYLILGQKKSGNPYNKQDIQVLEIVVNELVIAIQNAMRFEEIQAFNVTLQEKVNDATRQLRKTNEKLKALDETKDEFISMASHQLRTPLTSVKGYVSMVIEGDAGKISKQQHELLGQAFASSQRMVYLIADLLNVSRLRTGKFVIENKPTQLADVIETEISQLKEAATGKHQTLTYTKPKNFPELNMDETKIRQVIMNFTDNALYYTPAGGHINLKLEDKGNTIEFTVVDDGIGVPKDEQHHLFGKFYRAGNAKKARPDGTGLGLFMAKKVIIAQGGAVIFHSEENKGSTFGFSFPKEKLKITKTAKPASEPMSL